MPEPRPIVHMQAPPSRLISVASSPANTVERRRAASTYALWTGAIALVLGLFQPGTADVLALELPGIQPTGTQASVTTEEVRLENNLIRVVWSCADRKLRPVRVEDLIAGKQVDQKDCELFRLVLADGRVLRASELKLTSSPMARVLGLEPGASILSERSSGCEIYARLASSDALFLVDWRAILRDGGNAVRQEFTFRTQSSAISIKETCLIELPGDGVQSVGTVPGSPLVIGNLFFAYEHPDARSTVGDKATCALPFNLSLAANQSVRQTAVAGVVPEGQLRRGFAYYVERERAHPYRPFLHYNAWYDICWGDRKITEAECLNAIEIFGRELIGKREVPLASFVWDDGWDDPKTLWRPIQQNFPNGFDKILAAARAHRSTLGFWLSPFGGYGKPKDDRIAMGKEQGFEIGPEGFSLAGPKYYARFLETCSGFIQRDGANFFKFDGLARSVNETEAMLRLTRALRASKPDLFISITTGTWPSPFWLWYGDSTWRGGGDMGFHGAGSRREQWITYRDMETYRNVVKAAPLYPINSLMTQGFAHARYGTAAEVGSDPEEIRRELESFFASGTCLQELYVTPEKMTARNWDDLAETAKWAHANADVLVDTHWVGGDPGKNEPYGWASWSRRKGILALRNPGTEPASITVDVGLAFELPEGEPKAYALKSPWRANAEKPVIRAQAGEPWTFQLAPFEVLVFDAMPEPGK